MKGFVSLAVFALTMSTAFATHANCVGKKHGTRVPHSSVCEKFIVCEGGGVEMDCPEPLHFSPTLQVCDWPERAGCAFGPNPPGPTDVPTPTTPPGPTDPTSPTEPPSPSGSCKSQPLGKHVNHASDCTKFIVCIGNGVEMDCPAPLHFNAKLQVCDWPERAGCAFGPNPPGPTDLPIPTTPPGPTDPTSPTDSPSPSGSCKGQPLGIHVKHVSDCTKFIVCIGGGVEMDCPAPLHFNAKLQVCDWPERAEC